MANFKDSPSLESPELPAKTSLSQPVADVSETNCVFTDRLAFLIAANESEKKPFQAGKLYVLASTEHQARIAIASHLYPVITSIKGSQMRDMNAAALKDAVRQAKSP